MKKSRFTRPIITLLSVVMFMMAFSVPAGADIGPKPSVRITFAHLGDELCYGTLLSDVPSNGPSSVWDGEEDHARHNENPNGEYEWQEFGYDIWKAFVDYGEQDDYFFLQEAWKINETKELVWTYFPPSKFKILLYFPETGEYAVSGVYESYAFDSYFTVNMEGAKRFTDKNKKLGPEDYLVAEKSYDYSSEIGSLVARILITIVLEMAIALLFGYREKKELLFLAGVNSGTQILLNVVLNLITYHDGKMFFARNYLLLELAVFAIEAVLFYYFLNKLSIRQKPKWLAVVYALVANAVSFGAGLLLANYLPDLF